jgi:hypothetical protein
MVAQYSLEAEVSGSGCKDVMNVILVPKIDCRLLESLVLNRASSAANEIAGSFRRKGLVYSNNEREYDEEREDALFEPIFCNKAGMRSLDCTNVASYWRHRYVISSNSDAQREPSEHITSLLLNTLGAALSSLDYIWRRDQSWHSRGVHVAPALLRRLSRPPCFDHGRSELRKHSSANLKRLKTPSATMSPFAHTNNKASGAVRNTSASTHHQVASAASSSAGQPVPPSTEM